jgi:hypothetical protein
LKPKLGSAPDIVGFYNVEDTRNPLNAKKDQGNSQILVYQDEGLVKTNEMDIWFA